jgi:hypothetical protein
VVVVHVPGDGSKVTSIMTGHPLQTSMSSLMIKRV